MYEDFWEAAVGRTVVCVLEPGNFYDRNAVGTVAVEKDGRIFGHLLRKVSRVCAIFLKIGGTVCCTVTGRWYMYIGKTTRRAKMTDYLCNLLYHSSSIFRRTNYSLIYFSWLRVTMKIKLPRKFARLRYELIHWY